METNLPSQTHRIGKRGAWVVPANLRKHYGLEEGSLIIAEPRPDGILLKPAIVSPALSTPAASDSLWGEWFGLMGEVKATSEEIEDARTEGRR